MTVAQRQAANSYTYFWYLYGVRDVLFEVVESVTKHSSWDDRGHVCLVPACTITLGNGEHHPRLVHAENHTHFTTPIDEKCLQWRRNGDAALDTIATTAFEEIRYSDKVPSGGVLWITDSLGFITWKHTLQVALSKPREEDGWRIALHKLATIHGWRIWCYRIT